MEGYLKSNRKSKCFGCEACAQICPVSAIQMEEDGEGFRYPRIDARKCIGCKRCETHCPATQMPPKHGTGQSAWGGWVRDEDTLFNSTSGGVFSAIARTWGRNATIYGAAAEGLEVFHTSISGPDELDRLQKSKYSQSRIGTTFSEAARDLGVGKKVLYTGTPCQIAGLLRYLDRSDLRNLLTVEVFCESVPSPLFLRKYDDWLAGRYGARIDSLDYRYTGRTCLGRVTGSGKWDFEIMRISLDSGRSLKTDAWFSPFWSIWLNHLMSRPSCYSCPFTTQDRVADLSLGDLWGVQKKWPELYNRNRGASLVICNTPKGEDALKQALPLLEGHEFDFAEVKSKRVMNESIPRNPDRDAFMADLKDPDMDYKSLCRRWSKRPSVRLLFEKYIWGNRQKVALWQMKQTVFRRKNRN